MLSEVVDRLVQLGVEAKGKRVHKAPGDPDHVYWLESPEGALTLTEAAPRPREHTASDLSAIVSMAVAFAREDSPGRCVVWFSRKGVVLFLDDDTRRDRVTLPL